MTERALNFVFLTIILFMGIAMFTIEKFRKPKVKVINTVTHVLLPVDIKNIKITSDTLATDKLVKVQIGKVKGYMPSSLVKKFMERNENRKTEF